MKFEMKVLSPVHIGNGNKISPFEYLMHGKFHRVDMSSLFKDDAFDVEQFIKKIDDLSFFGMGFDNGKRFFGMPFEDVQKKHVRYSLTVGDAAKAMRGGKEVSEFIKTRGQVFIPGSSLKGAIRTAFLYYVLKHDEGLYDAAVRTLQGNAQRYRRNPCDAIEKMVFGDSPTEDVMKAFIVSDTNVVSPGEVLQLQSIGVLSATAFNQLREKFSLLAECLGIESMLSFSIKLDEFFFKSSIADLGFSKGENDVVALAEICNDYADDLIDYEYNFFKQYQTEYEDVLRFYEWLSDFRYETLRENEFLLRLAWGSGWQTMTIGRLFQDEPVFNQLRSMYRLGRKNVDVFPKSRRVVYDEKIYPLGWIHVRECS